MTAPRSVPGCLLGSSNSGRPGPEGRGPGPGPARGTTAGPENVVLIALYISDLEAPRQAGPAPAVQIGGCKRGISVILRGEQRPGRT